MEPFRDFRDILNKLKDKRVRLCFTVIDMSEGGRYTLYGRIRGMNGHMLEFEFDPQKYEPTTDVPLIKTHLNLGAVVIYAVDEIPEDADLTEKPEGKYGDVETVIEVRIGDDPETVKAYTDQGYEMENFYSGKVQLIKRKTEEAEG